MGNIKCFLLALLLLPTFSMAQTAKRSYATDKVPGTECNNVINNKLDPVGVMRSPSECEVLFDHHVRVTFDEAFSNLFFRKGGDWAANEVPNLDQINAVGKGTEIQCFRLKDTDKGDFNFDMQAHPTSPDRIAWAKRYDSLTHLSSGPVAYEKLRQFLYDAKTSTRIVLYTEINAVSASMTFYKGGHEILKIPNTFFVIRGPYVAANTGGGEDNVTEACLVLIGKWKSANVKKESDGTFSFQTDGLATNASPHLRVQNIYMRIECNKEMQDRLLKEIDFAKLNELLR